MGRFLRIAAPVALLLACSDEGADPLEPEPPPGDGSFAVSLQPVGSGFTAPLLVTAPPGDARLFVVQQDGQVRIVRNGTVLPTPFLDLRGRVAYTGESGLLGLAFHPQYATNGYFFVHYTVGSYTTFVERYRVSADPDRADPASVRTILTFPQPFGNHNGGHIEFDPDGMLLIGLGDGGSGGDPLGHGQNRNTLFGSILRLDVDRGNPYAIPADNPFRDTPGARGEIWAYGLRNPWRFAVDAPGNRIYIADVGQSRFEEVNVARLDAGGLNYGWNVMEGRSCFAQQSCSMTGLTLPAVQYGHDQGCSITGGVVYRGTAIPGLVGHYVYSDYCAGWIRSFLMTDAGPTLEREWSIPDLPFVTSFGRDAAGEIYVTTVRSDGTGQVLRVVPST